MSKLTKRIDSVLDEKGITKKDFYSNCGITSSAYSQWNTGKTEPRKATLQKVSEYLKVNYEWLASGAGEKEKVPTPVSESGQDRNIIKIAGRDGSFVERELTDDQLALMKNMLDQLKPIDDDRI